MAELEPDDAARAAFCVAMGAELRATVRAQCDDIGERLVPWKGLRATGISMISATSTLLTMTDPSHAP